MDNIRRAVNTGKSYAVKMLYNSEGIVNAVIITDSKIDNTKMIEIEQQAEEIGIDQSTLENKRAQEEKEEKIEKERTNTILICGLILFEVIILIVYLKKAKKENNIKSAIFRILVTIIITIIFVGLLIFYNLEVGLVGTVYKPVIYLYPTETTTLTVKVGKPEKLTHTYPKYKNEWKITANPNGNLVDNETSRNLYCLYWEGINTIKPNMQEGFIVKGEDTISFLEDKLEILGLNEREANEFIIYWLPKLEVNKYNYIRFQTIKEINENMPLEIMPKPDTLIRVMMEYKRIDRPIEVKEQELITPKRNGFTVVEWGGTCID